ncbi:creatininase [Perkinsela sp. CCAP 1560/4]|nr:creatininase [Perkinsela sp. CCAP 1560/4]|eukprot:KNH05301.1 creatininase [Perkinsela sp. CCAP 1560/4]
MEDTNAVNVVVQSTVHQEEMVISNDMLILDMPCDVYDELVESSTSSHEGTAVYICGNNANATLSRKDLPGTSSMRASMEMAYLCTGDQTYDVYHHEQNAPLMLCRRTTEALTITFTTRLSYGASHRLIRPNFSLMTRMMGQSNDFLLDQSDLPDTIHAFTRHDYISAVPASPKEIERELFCRGLRPFQAPYLQAITHDQIDPVIDAIVTQLVGIQLQHEKAFPAITKVPVLLAVDALREIYPETVLSYAVDVIGDVKSLQYTVSHSGTTRCFQLVCLNLRGYIRHKIHCCFKQKQILSGIEMENELRSRVPFDIANLLHERFLQSGSTHQSAAPSKPPSVFPFSETFFRGIAIQRRHTTEAQISLDNMRVIPPVPIEEFHYIPFWRHHSSDAETTVQSLLRTCGEWKKTDLACYLLPFLDGEPTQPIDDSGLYDDWTFEPDCVRRMSACPPHDGKLITDDHQACMQFIEATNEDGISPIKTPTPNILFHSHREKLLEKLLNKTTKEIMTDGEVVYTSNDP